MIREISAAVGKTSNNWGYYNTRLKPVINNERNKSVSKERFLAVTAPQFWQITSLDKYKSQRRSIGQVFEESPELVTAPVVQLQQP